MRTRLYPSLLALLLACAACNDDNEPRPRGRTTSPDRGTKPKPPADDKPATDMPADAEPGGGQATAAGLERPGTLPRPPKDRLPAELRPPR